MKKIISKECRFSIHIPKIENIREDTHYIKELIHYDDGSSETNIKLTENIKRPFWITKPDKRNHSDKKESEIIENLDMFTSTQSDLVKNIANVLKGKYINAKKMSQISMSPYVYGIDVSTETLIKNEYMSKYTNVITPYSITVLDIEVDVETNELAIITICTNNNCFTCINEKYIKDIDNLNNKMKNLYDLYIPKTDISNKINLEIYTDTREINLIKAIFKKLNEYNPDIVLVWNINYDLPFIIQICLKNKIHPKYILTDPDIPNNLKIFDYIEGQTTKVTASDKHRPLNPEEQWHTVKATSKYVWIDAMSAYWFIRVGGKKLPTGYSLDSVLNYELGSEYKKIKFKDENLKNKIDIDWHKYMLKNKPLEYTIYNIWDCMSILELDNRTKDYSYGLPLLSGVSSFNIFNSGPKKLIDALHFFYLKKGRVLGVKPSVIKEKETLGLENWISILDNSLINKNKGYLCLKENNVYNTNIRRFIYDADQSSGYPSNTLAGNVSLDSTSKELLSIANIDKELFKIENINIMFGKINALSYATNILNAPSLLELSNMYDLMIKEKKVKEKK